MKKPKTRPARTSRSTPFVLRLLRFLSDFFSLSLFLYFFFDVFGHSPHTQTATYEREHILPYIGQRNASIVGHECCTRAYVSKLMSVCVCVWWCKLQCSPLQHYRRFVRCACAHLYRLSICCAYMWCVCVRAKHDKRMVKTQKTRGNQHVLTCLGCVCQIKLINDTTPNVILKSNSNNNKTTTPANTIHPHQRSIPSNRPYCRQLKCYANCTVYERVKETQKLRFENEGSTHL